jgi:hypothetical protein
MESDTVVTVNEYDLLSARNQAEKVLADVEEAWGRVNEKFASLKLPCTVQLHCEVGPDASRDEYDTGLMWCKENGKWQVCYFTWCDWSETGITKPVLELPTYWRAKALKWVPALYAEVEPALRRFVRNAEEDMAECADRVNKVLTHIDRMTAE